MLIKTPLQREIVSMFQRTIITTSIYGGNSYLNSCSLGSFENKLQPPFNDTDKEELKRALSTLVRRKELVSYRPFTYNGKLRQWGLPEIKQDRCRKVGLDINAKNKARINAKNKGLCNVN